ncbi:predicted protein [Lichtheimia corymbifera JMRC:FSU:9682]|uniref:Uncharacterized protein n=1 Tax=Lichtheimia corymbifera JMRC:FSU:9682 TaxID=1263082 RepID=A0A068RX49_9FUNG|nr:predicted protein [Lichtheimia corymbifera JMRC:FSU:9682]
MGLPYWRPREERRTRNSTERIRHGTDQRLDSLRTTLRSSSRSHPLPANGTSHRRSRAALGARRAEMLPRRLRRRHNDVVDDAIAPVDDLDRLVQQRFDEKEDLLCQLEFTASLLDQFLSARSALGADSNMTLPSFITDELPSILSTAANLTMETYNQSSSSSLPSSRVDHSNMTEAQLTREFADHLLHLPPYSTRLQILEGDIQSVHRRIMDQLGMLGSTDMLQRVQSPAPAAIGDRPLSSLVMQYSRDNEDNH